MIRHGHARKGATSPEYYTWYAMKRRCVKRQNYVSRGITVCERWMVFENFLQDMGLRPGKGYSIERKNNDSGYDKGNCVWATAFEQNWNKGDRPNCLGASGVSFDKSRNKYRARVDFNGKIYLIKRFASLDEARAAVIFARQEIKSSLSQGSEVRSEFSPAHEEVGPSAASGPAVE